MTRTFVVNLRRRSSFRNGTLAFDKSRQLYSDRIRYTSCLEDSTKHVWKSYTTIKWFATFCPQKKKVILRIRPDRSLSTTFELRSNCFDTIPFWYSSKDPSYFMWLRDPTNSPAHFALRCLILTTHRRHSTYNFSSWTVPTSSKFSWFQYQVSHVCTDQSVLKTRIFFFRLDIVVTGVFWRLTHDWNLFPKSSSPRGDA